MEGCKLVRIPVFLRDCRMCLGVPVKFTSQALASFKRQQEQSFQDQNTLAAEARETRRQELLEKIVEGQAAKKQKLEQDSGADEGGQEAGGSEATQGSETSDDGQPSAEQEGAGEILGFRVKIWGRREGNFGEF